MRRIVLVAALLVGSVLPVASAIDSADVGVRHNGLLLNGPVLNGIRLNGIRLNGVRLNGVSNTATAEAAMVDVGALRVIRIQLPAAVSAPGAE